MENVVNNILQDIYNDDTSVSINVNLYPDHINMDSSWIEIAQECRKIQTIRKSIEVKEELLIKKLKELSMGMSCKGGGFIFTRTLRKGTVDYSRIPQLSGIDLEPYRKSQTESWKLDQIVSPYLEV